VTSVAWSPDGQRILTGSYDNTAKVWDALKGQEVLSLKGHTNTVTCVAWSPDGQRILTGSTDNTAKVWDALKGQEVLSLKGHTDLVTSLAWSPDGKVLFAWDQADKVLAWYPRKRGNRSPPITRRKSPPTVPQSRPMADFLLQPIRTSSN
jgi:WD40 repeat protein